jgi:hypothetical protein
MLSLRSMLIPPNLTSVRGLETFTLMLSIEP